MAAAKTTPAAAAVFTLTGEIIGVTILGLVAGTNKDAGHAILVFMLALWLIYLITDGSRVIGGINAKFERASKQVA